MRRGATNWCVILEILKEISNSSWINIEFDKTEVLAVGNGQNADLVTSFGAIPSGS